MYELQLGKWNSDVDNFILDGEVVYVSPTGKFMEFQDMDRKWKTKDESGVEKQPQVLIFDILNLNGTSLKDVPLKYRKKMLLNKLSLSN